MSAPACHSGFRKAYGIVDPPTIEVRPSRKSLAIISRMICTQPTAPQPSPPATDGSLMSYKVRGSQATNIWISGKHRVKPPTPQAHFDLRDCRVPLVGDT